MDIELDDQEQVEPLMRLDTRPPSITLKAFQRKLSGDVGQLNGVCVVKRDLEPHWNNVTLTWQDLTYTVRNKDLWKSLSQGELKRAFTRKTHPILHKQSGSITTGCLTAVLGKSGSGKTSLIESLAGRRTQGLDGVINITVCSGGNCKSSKLVKMSFIPQEDSLLGMLTVEESLRFASKLKNVQTTGKSQHEKIVADLIQQLDLETCRRVYVCSCSGGQRKRLSIAMELVSKPTILILDEPTSGLDSSSAFQCVRLLRKLTEGPKNPLAIMATVHQPSAKTLSLFHNLYLLSNDGRCIYFGLVTNLLSHFAKFQLQCPEYTNPADYAIEVAAGDYGDKVITEMENSQVPLHDKLQPNDLHTFSVFKIISSTRGQSFACFFQHSYVLLKRTLLATMRDPVLNFFRLFQHVFVALVIASLYKSAIGEEGGCITTGGQASYDDMIGKQTLTSQNVAFFFFSLMFLCFASMMPTVMVFPTEMSVFLRERTNGWYSCLSYYIAKTVADFPFQLFYTSVYVLITYHLTGQIQSHWRFLVVLLISLLISGIGQSYGLMMGAIFCSHLNVAIFIAPVSTLPFILISGFFIKTSTMPTYMQPVTCISYLKYAFEALITATYGYGRCNLEVPINATSTESDTCSALFQFYKYLQVLNVSYPTLRPVLSIYLRQTSSAEDLENMDKHFNALDGMDIDQYIHHSNHTVENVSLVMKEFDLEDEYLYSNVLILLLLFVISRIVTYVIFFVKANRRK